MIKINAVLAWVAPAGARIKSHRAAFLQPGLLPMLDCNRQFCLSVCLFVCLCVNGSSSAHRQDGPMYYTSKLLALVPQLCMLKKSKNMKTTYPVTLKGKSYWLVSHRIMGFCIFYFPPYRNFLGQFFLPQNSNMKIGGNCTICGIHNKGWRITLCSISSWWQFWCDDSWVYSVLECNINDSQATAGQVYWRGI